MLAYPEGQDLQVLSSMYIPAAQAAQNVAPASELVPFGQIVHCVLLDSSENVFAAQSWQSEEIELPVPAECLPGGHALQSDSTPVADEYLPCVQFSHALSSASRSAGDESFFPCFPAGHSVHSVASSSVFAYFPCTHSSHTVCQ